MKRCVELLLASLLAGCSTAGPFVTSISNEGNGNLRIEKCNVQLNAFLWTISNHDCSSSQIKVAEADTQSQPQVPTQFQSQSPSDEQVEPQNIERCCKICTKGKACGDSCISRAYVCRKGPGCACDAQ